MAEARVLNSFAVCVSSQQRSFLVFKVTKEKLHPLAGNENPERCCGPTVNFLMEEFHAFKLAVLG